MRGSIFEMAAILAIVLLLFGPTQLPKLIKSIKQGKEELTSSANVEDKAQEVESK